MIQFKDGTTNEDAADFVDLDRLEQVIQGKDLKVTIGPLPLARTQRQKNSPY